MGPATKGSVGETVYEVTAIRFATVQGRRSQQFYNYARYGEPDGDIELSCSLWVLRSATQTIVVDTGFDPAVAHRRGHAPLFSPVDALRRCGIDPREVSDVILTHLHYDHVGNVEAFSNAALVVPRRELEFWTSPLASRLQFGWTVEPQEIATIAKAHREGRVRLTGNTEPLFDGITSHCVGGHSPGQQVTVVAAAGGPVVLASDAIHFYEELELDRPYMVVADLAEMYAAYDLVRGMAETPGAIVVPGHDPRVFDLFPSAAEDLDGNAVRVA